MDIKNQKAMIGLLACVMFSDEKTETVEQDYMDVLCLYHNFTKDMSRDQYNQIVVEVNEEIKSLGWLKASGQYSEQISPKFRRAILLLVMDMSLIDGHMHPSEMKLLSVIIKKYQINKEKAIEDIKIFMDKNGVHYPDGPLI